MDTNGDGFYDLVIPSPNKKYHFSINDSCDFAMRQYNDQTGKWTDRLMMPKKIGYTGTTDNNGFLTTWMDSRTHILLTVTSLTVNGVITHPYTYNCLLNGGMGTQIALRFYSWSGNMYTGNMSIEMIYMILNPLLD